MRRRGLEPHSSDSEESEGEASPLGSSDSESEDEAPVLARRRGARGEEDEGEEGAASESQSDSDQTATDTEDDSDVDSSDEENTKPAPIAIAKRPAPAAGTGKKEETDYGGRGRGKGRGVTQKPAPASSSSGNAGRGTRAKAQQQTQTQIQSGAKKLVYRPKNAAPAEGSSAISAEGEWGDVESSSPTPVRGAGRGRGKKGDGARPARNKRDRKVKREGANATADEQQITPPVEAADGATQPPPPRAHQEASKQGKQRRGRKQPATHIAPSDGDQSAGAPTTRHPSSTEGADAEQVVGEDGSGEGGEEGGPQRNKKKPDPDDPQFVPRGRFFMHDDRYGGKGPGPRPPRQRPDGAYDAEQEEIWMHDGYERLEREERDGRKGRSRRRGKQAAGGGRGGGAAAAPEPGVAVADGAAAGGAQHPPATVAAASPAAGRGESGKRARGKGQRQPSGGRGTPQAGANQPVQDHVTSPMGNGGPKRYSSQRVATTDEAASLAAKAVAAAVSSTGAPINPAVAAAGGHPPHFAPGGYASSPIRPNAQPFRPKGRGNGASTLYVPMGYGPYVPEYGAGATYYPPPPAFPAYGYTQGGQFPEPNNYLEPDPAIIDASVPTYQMAGAAGPAPPTDAGGPDPTMMNPQLTPYGAYPPPFFYTAPVYHPYMGDHQSGGGRGRGRGRGHHMAPPPIQGTVYYPPPVIEVEAETEEGMYEEQDRFESSAEGTASAEQAEAMNGNGHDNGNGHSEDATPLAPQPQPQPQPATITPAVKSAGSKMRAKAPKWVPKAAANANTNTNTTPMSDAETAAS